ncbi:MAG: F0F1 ATP synthase subunit B [Phycisphaerae bacterium]
MRLKHFGMSGLLAVVLLAGGVSAYAQGNAASEEPAAKMENTELKESHPAADAIHEELDMWTLLTTIAIFVVLLAVLSATAWKPILGGLKAREAAIRDSVEAAARAKADAERTTRELEEKMAEVQRQSAQQLQQAKADAQKVADTIRQQAEVESAALKDRTLREIDGAKQQALAEINAHAAMLGTAVASKILKRSVTADDQQRLVEESLAELAKKN